MNMLKQWQHQGIPYYHPPHLGPLQNAASMPTAPIEPPAAGAAGPQCKCQHTWEEEPYGELHQAEDV